MGSSPAVEEVAARGPGNVSIQTAPHSAVGMGVSWPQALRRMRGWLAPWMWLQRLLARVVDKRAARQLQQALEWVGVGQPIYLYLPP